MYATVDEMISRFGEAEMVRLSAPEGQLDDVVVTSSVERALAEASSLIDGYLRQRYAVPLAAPVAPEVVRACCILARHDLAMGEQKNPSEQMVTSRKEVMAWLRDVAEGRVQLAGPVTAVTGSAGAAARVQDRAAPFAAGGSLGW